MKSPCSRGRKNRKKKDGPTPDPPQGKGAYEVKWDIYEMKGKGKYLPTSAKEKDL